MMKRLDRDTLEKLYVKEQKSTSEIAKQFGCTPRTIQLKCRKFGIKLRPKGGKLEYINKSILQKLYVEENKSLREISKILSCSPSVIKKRRKEYGIRLIGNRKTVELDRETLQDLYVDEKKSIRDIAKIIECSREVVRIRCKKFGIPLRSSRSTFYATERTA